MNQGPQYQFTPLGDSSVLLRKGTTIDQETHRWIMAVMQLLEAHRFEGMIECVPAFASIAVHYDPLAVWRSRSLEEQGHASVYATVCERLEHRISSLQDEFSGSLPARVVTIPVCYGGDYGPDLQEVAEYCGMSAEEVVSHHTSGAYSVYMIGFAPGFPYLGGMPSRIAAPRRKTPRIAIPAGSVGIAGAQTGVYPLATPGGWQLIGRTPLPLFLPDQPIPSLLRAGDEVKFEAISERQFMEWEELYRNGLYSGQEAGGR
ncbi:5-oxoprolinase subunit PxpB [Paenibacillus sp. 1011MAR3C5]|uniref:5-oxoprolinase subunit PxpB n=1 Tax=Paenibacillus sp. 1011MAR3C5 TaxID=1675787 RepID=UPI000E6BB136|nr:5-oxoprolinase subunit PxpB [Paenibacillus sp. 1011MAR3C5]RJE88671.1 5-oxoprolinase subunit PxpB [Paenibacillus sp. 1011MAR3C5]